MGNEKRSIICAIFCCGTPCLFLLEGKKKERFNKFTHWHEQINIIHPKLCSWGFCFKMLPHFFQSSVVQKKQKTQHTFPAHKDQISSWFQAHRSPQCIRAPRPVKNVRQFYYHIWGESGTAFTFTFAENPVPTILTYGFISHAWMFVLSIMMGDRRSCIAFSAERRLKYTQNWKVLGNKILYWVFWDLKEHLNLDFTGGNGTMITHYKCPKMSQCNSYPFKLVWNGRSR